MDRKFTWIAAAALALAPVAAEAKLVPFSFETTDGLFTVSGDLTIADTLDSVGGYDVTAISGTVDRPGGETAISGLVANPERPDPYDNGSWLYDNVLFTTGPYFDNPGLLFAAGGNDYNLFSEGWTYTLSSYDPEGSYFPGQTVGGIVVSIPEPATWLMMGLGFAALGLGGRKASRETDRAAFG
jgi:hypothetical protein